MSLQCAAQFGVTRRASFVLAAWCSVLVASAGWSQQVRPTASLKGTVRDAHGTPISGATVRLQPVILQPSGGTQAFSAASDSSGAFTLAGLPTGPYDVSAEMKGYKRTEIPSFSIQPEAVNEIHLTLALEQSGAAAGGAATKFYDEPHFTVSGVTDTTSLGGHGSDTVVRTRDSLAKETVALGGRESKLGAGPSREELEADRARAQALVARDPQRAEPHHLLADAEEKLGDSLAAVREYQRAAELEPRESYLFDWGSELLLHHAPEPALEVFTQGNRLFPRSSRMLLGMGAAWFAQGSLDQAVKRICEASDLNPNDAAPYIFLGKMESAEKIMLPTVAEALHRFVTLQPASAEANYYYAAALWKLRRGPTDTPQVESLLNNAIHLDPKFTAAYVQLGILHTDQRDFLKAISDFQQAIQSGPEAPDSYDPQVQEAHFRLVQAYRQIGEGDKAKAELKLYDQMVKASEQEVERQRHEIPQFVYTLRDQPPPQAR